MFYLFPSYYSALFCIICFVILETTLSESVTPEHLYYFPPVTLLHTEASNKEYLMFMKYLVLSAIESFSALPARTKTFSNWENEYYKIKKFRILFLCEIKSIRVINNALVAQTY